MYLATSLRKNRDYLIVILLETSVFTGYPSPLVVV